MDDKMLREVLAFQQQAKSLRCILADAKACAPSRASGEDATGTVQVDIGSNGLPTRIDRSGQWRSRLAPSGLGDAVQEAFGAAARARLAEWSAILERGSFQQDTERIMRGDSNASGWATPASQVPAMFRAAPSTAAPPSDLNELAEEMTKSLRGADERAACSAGLTEVTGRSASGDVAIALSRTTGLVGCRISSRWAQEVTDTELSRAIARALEDAHVHLGAQRADAGTSFDGMFAEVIGFLQDPTRLRP